MMNCVHLCVQKFSFVLPRHMLHSRVSNCGEEVAWWNLSKTIRRAGQTLTKINIIKGKGLRWNLFENGIYPLPHVLQLGTREQASFTAFFYGNYQIVWAIRNLENLDHNLKHKPYVNKLEFFFSICWIISKISFIIIDKTIILIWSNTAVSAVAAELCT